MSSSDPEWRQLGTMVKWELVVVYVPLIIGAFVVSIPLGIYVTIASAVVAWIVHRIWHR